MRRYYKALVIDFDGTLANGPKGVITENVQKAIKNVVKEGYSVSIVTGRPYFGRIREVCRELNLRFPQIVHGGAEIRNPENDTVLWAKYLDNQDTRELIEYFHKRNLYFTLEKDNEIFTSDGKRALYPKIYGDSFVFKNAHDKEVENIAKLVIPSTFNKLSLSEIDAIITELEVLYKNIHVIKGKIEGTYGLDITAAEANKHIATLEYMKLLNLSKEEVIGVGDNYNDFPLLTACGLKVAMGDAPKELKEIADIVVPPQSEDGLLQVIDSYLQ